MDEIDKNLPRNNVDDLFNIILMVLTELKESVPLNDGINTCKKVKCSYEIACVIAHLDAIAFFLSHPQTTKSYSLYSCQLNFDHPKRVLNSLELAPKNNIDVDELAECILSNYKQHYRSIYNDAISREFPSYSKLHDLRKELQKHKLYFY